MKTIKLALVGAMSAALLLGVGCKSRTEQERLNGRMNEPAQRGDSSPTGGTGGSGPGDTHGSPTQVPSSTPGYTGSGITGTGTGSTGSTGTGSMDSPTDPNSTSKSRAVEPGHSDSVPRDNDSEH